MTSEQKGIVMGVITTPGSNMHAVILKERAYGVYSYYDPTTGVSGQLLAGSIAYAGKVTGLKEKEGNLDYDKLKEKYQKLKKVFENVVFLIEGVLLFVAL